MNPHCPEINEFALSEADELLAEVCLDTGDGAQPRLATFADLVRNLIVVCRTQSHEPTDFDPVALQAFVSQSLEAVREAIESPQSNSTLIDALSEQALATWGDYLLRADIGSPLTAEPTWHGATASGLGDPEEEEELQVPSASDIQALMDQWNGTTRAALPVEPVSPALQTQTVKPAAQAPAALDRTDQLDPELREAFIDDASSCLSSIESALLRLESNSHDTESLAQILRELHTLKGASGSVGLLALAENLHQLEDTLRDDSEAGRQPSIDQLLTSVAHIRASIGGTEQTLPPPTAETRAPAQPGRSMQSANSPVFAEDDSDTEMVRVKSSQLNRLMDMLVELVMLRNQRETELNELQEVYHTLITSGSKMRLLSNDRESGAGSNTSLQLSEVASDVLEAAQQIRDCARPFAAGNAAVSRFIRQFRQELVALRRTPISGLFRRLQLVVREAAKAESKQVRLVLKGEDAGIERSLQQRLYEPLLHIIRNAIGHGIESAEDRGQHGKSPEGVITLEATSGPNLFVIEISDDGRGLDYEAIRRRGVERKLITADQVLSRDELSQLIFQPGFSTRETANQIGGRGVGMDVVAATLQRLRGWFEIASEPGQGTRIRLHIPLPSVIQHAMVFRSADQLFALPMESVQAAGDVSADIPRAEFAALLGLTPSTFQQPTQAIVVGDERLGGTRGKSNSLAFMVDGIVGPEELVVRPLPALLKHHPYCVGATLSGMGQTVILLDARRLLSSQSSSLTRVVWPAPGANAQAPCKARAARPRVLVVDDSLSARKRVVRSLQRYPLDIIEAADGKQALELVKKHSLAAIFSDMEMPNVDGMELLANLHDVRRADTPAVVIISSRSESEFTQRARQLGATDYLIKPLVDEDLDSALLQIAALSHLVLNEPPLPRNAPSQLTV
jgi:chemosensory pili system protein ChpA (sensor histidine kinase/response regulator)